MCMPLFIYKILSSSSFIVVPAFDFRVFATIQKGRN